VKIYAIKCRKCQDIIWSRARHDFRWCTCRSIAIDGGWDYSKTCGELENIENVTIDLPITEKDAYNDWNYRNDKLGLIPHEQKVTIIEDKNETTHA